MLRVVLDTNVLVSALIKPGSVPDLLLVRFARDEAFELILSTAILEELRRVVRYPAVRKRVKGSEDELELRIAMLDTLASIVEAGRAGVGAVRDPDDEAILAAAVEGRADLIVTGDDDLLSLVEFEGIRIVRPRAFLELLDSRSGEPGAVHERVAPYSLAKRGRTRGVRHAAK